MKIPVENPLPVATRSIQNKVAYDKSLVRPGVYEVWGGRDKFVTREFGIETSITRNKTLRDSYGGG